MIGFAIPLNNIYVAFDFGFGSVDGYQRAFRKEFGCNPKEYAANPIPLHLFTPYGVKFRYLERKETTVSVKNVFICGCPPEYIKSGTSEYVQGVEVADDYNGEIPDGFDVIELPAEKYLMFQGEPFKEEEYEQAITDIWESEKKYDPSVIGYRWDNSNPKIQLEPIGTRGYIELLPIENR